MTIPPIIVAIKDIGIHLRRILPICPCRPILSEIGRISEHIGTISLVRERVLAIGVRKDARGSVFGVGEDHDVISLSFPNQEMVDGLWRSKLASISRIKIEK